MSSTSAKALAAKGAAIAAGVSSAAFALVLSTPALALPITSAAAAPTGVQGFLSGPMGQVVLFLPIIVLFYFLIIRPQQRRAKEHKALIENVKRGDTIVMSSGMIGKVTRIEEQEAMVEIANGVNVRVVKAMITEVRTRGEPAKLATPKAAKS